GSSSKTCFCVKPDANKSNTSITRILMPRIHGRPPHWPIFTVILFFHLFIAKKFVDMLNSITKFTIILCYMIGKTLKSHSTYPKLSDRSKLPICQIINLFWLRRLSAEAQYSIFLIGMFQTLCRDIQ